MLLLAVLLLPVAVKGERYVQTENWTVTINDYGTLTNIGMNGIGSDDLDLSNLNIRAIDGNVFESLDNLKTLNLANNLLEYLDVFTMQYLVNLEHLDLANNRLKSGEFYDAFSRLKTLNISNNAMSYFESGHFFGLSNFVNILTQGIWLLYINTEMFETEMSETKRPPMDAVGDGGSEATALNANCKQTPQFKDISNLTHSADEFWVKVCIDDTHQLKSVKGWNKNENSLDCKVLQVAFGSLRISGLTIRTFGSRWYHLQDPNVKALNLEYNQIIQVTENMLNDLPPGIVHVNLRGNKIRRIKRGIIKNANPIELLDLCRNNISEIEVGALEEVNLTDMLLLCSNRLNNTKFLDSLPSNIHEVSLAANHITEISAGNFSKFACFINLDLSYNNITEVKSGDFRGFSSLLLLKLSHNRLRTMEPGFFRDLKNLVSLHLNDNSITRLESSFSMLPASLHSLYLSNNRIESLNAENFVNVPKGKLALDGNQISKIESRSFNLPHLQELDLQNNSLKEIDGDSFKGLMNLDRLSLALNGITTIKKGAAKNLNHLSILDLSYNPIKIFENGALFGLPKTKEFRIELFGDSVEIIQGGLFDDV